MYTQSVVDQNVTMQRLTVYISHECQLDISSKWKIQHSVVVKECNLFQTVYISGIMQYKNIKILTQCGKKHT